MLNAPKPTNDDRAQQCLGHRTILTKAHAILGVSGPHFIRLLETSVSLPMVIKRVVLNGIMDETISPRHLDEIYTILDHEELSMHALQAHADCPPDELESLSQYRKTAARDWRILMQTLLDPQGGQTAAQKTRSPTMNAGSKDRPRERRIALPPPPSPSPRMDNCPARAPLHVEPDSS